MKKYSAGYIAALLFLIIGIFLNAERIINNDVVIQINKDKSITVNEKIEYEFDSLDRRGIFRDIPLRNEENRGEIGKSLIELNKITKNGVKEKYATEEFKSGIRYIIGEKNKNIDRLVNVYEINYTMPNEIPEKDGVYQIYFNAVGQFWPVPIENATVTVKFPEGQPIEKNEILKFEVYTGAQGEKSDNYEIIQDEGEIKIKTKALLPEKNGLTFLMHTDTKKINPASWDRIKLNYYLEPIKFIAPGVILIILLYCIGTWLKFGKDFEKRTIVPNFNPPKDISAMFINCFESERKGRGIDRNKMLSVGILSLISKDYINTVKVGTGEKTSKYYLNESKVKNLKNDRNSDLFYSESEIAKTLRPGEKMFSNNEKIYEKTREIADLYDRDYKKIMYDKNVQLKIPVMFTLVFLSIMTLIAAEIKTVAPLTLILSVHMIIILLMGLIIYCNKDFKECIVDRKIFNRKIKIAVLVTSALFLLPILIIPGLELMTVAALTVSLGLGVLISVHSEIRGGEKKGIVKTVLGILGISFYLLMMFFTKNGIYSIVIFAIYMIYSRLMIERFTEKGMRTKEIIDGMKMYIRTAEENQIKRFNNMEELVSFFRRILPFAMAIGVENEALRLMQKTIARNNFRSVSMEDLEDVVLATGLLNETGRAYTLSRKIYSEKFSSSSSSSGSGGSFSSGGGGYSGGGSGGGGGGSW